MNEKYNNLKKIRKERGLTVKEVVEGTGIPMRTYQNYEYMEREIGAGTLQKLADFYGVTTDYLLGREPEPSNPIKDMSARLNLNPYESAIISAYLAMDSKSRKDLAKMIGDVAESIKSGTEYEKTYTMHIDPKESRREQEQPVKQSTTLGTLEDQTEEAAESNHKK